MDADLQSFWFGAAQFVFDPAGQEPTRIVFRLPALQLVVIERGQLPTDPQWSTPGIYFLFGAGASVGTYLIYVGMAPSGVAKRVSDQQRNKDWWDRALLVVADRSAGFSTSEVAWLEARFIAKLRDELGPRVANKNQPSSDRLEPWTEKELEAHVAPIEAVLRLLGMLSVSAEPQIVNDEEPDVFLSADPAPVTSPTLALEGSNAIGEAARETPRAKNPTWIEAALQVLPADGSGMHARDILARIVAGDIRDLTGMRTPENTLRRDLRQESQRPSPRVRQVGPSTFARGDGTS